MRFVPINCLQEGMVLGNTLYNKIGDTLLASGIQLSSRNISQLCEMKLNGAYIDDKLSEGITPTKLISDNTHSLVIKSLKNITTTPLNKGKKELRNDSQEMNNAIEHLVTEICENPSISVNIVDIKAYDEYTFAHSVNVATLSVIIGQSLGLSKNELINLGTGAILHDIGKIFISNSIINKGDPLTSAEISVIKEHPLKGRNYIEHFFSFTCPILVAIQDHHEKYDGTGYPNRRKGNGISLYGRIIAIADVYDALISDRSYRKGASPAEAIEYIMGQNGLHFDPEIEPEFIKHIAPYPIGSQINLSNGETGIVVENREAYGLRPILRVFMKNGILMDHIEIRDLLSHDSLNITIEPTKNLRESPGNTSCSL